MKKVMIIAVPIVAVATLFAWRITELLSPDAIGMAIGLMFGVLAGVPAAALVMVASRRTPYYGDEDGNGVDYYPHTVAQYQQPEYAVTVFKDSPVVPLRTPASALVFYEDVTPYYNGARRLMRMEPLPHRANTEPSKLTPEQIEELEAYIEMQKAVIRQVDPRQFIVRFSGDA